MITLIRFLQQVMLTITRMFFLRLVEAVSGNGGVLNGIKNKTTF